MDGFILMCWFWVMGHISGKDLHKKSYTPAVSPILSKNLTIIQHATNLAASFPSPARTYRRHTLPHSRNNDISPNTPDFICGPLSRT